MAAKNLPQSRYRGRGRELAWLGSRAGYSCNCRLSDSTSSDSAVSLATSASILRTACSTVVWSRPPNRRPISGSERSVSVLARYIATLPRADYIGRAPRGEKVGAADIILARHHALD